MAISYSTSIIVKIIENVDKIINSNDSALLYFPISSFLQHRFIHRFILA